MPYNGEKLFDVSEKEPQFSGSNFDILKLGKNETYKIVFYGGAESVVGEKQHTYWAKPFDSSIVTPNDEDVIFECFKSKHDDTKQPCPGCMYDSYKSMKWRYSVPVLVENEDEPKVLFFGPQVYKQMVNIYKGEFDDNGIKDDFNKYWFSLSRDDTTGRTEYTLRLTLAKVKDHESYPEVISVESRVKSDSEIDVALKMKENNLWNDDLETHYFAENEASEVVEEAS